VGVPVSGALGGTSIWLKSAAVVGAGARWLLDCCCAAPLLRTCTERGLNIQVGDALLCPHCTVLHVGL
jgi:hypothetical protein